MSKKVHKAEYIPQIIEDYKDNPFIEALPPIIPSMAEAVKNLSVKPPYNDAERELDQYYRLHCTLRLTRYFQPLYTHLDIEQRISRCIRQGYVTRNPFSPEYVQRIRKCNEAAKEHGFEKVDFRDVRSTAMGFTMIGMSGVGKTTAVDRILSMYPQYITHTKYKNKPFCMKQIVWMKLDCPFDGSIKGLCLNFFSELDRVLGSDYAENFISQRYTVDTLLVKMSHLASTHGLGILVIDEIQHLSHAKSGGSEKMLNFFVTLVNTIGVPVVLIGTSKALPILQSEFRQARRGSGQGDLIWDRMKNDESWDIMLRSMWKYQWTKVKCQLTDEIKDALYDETQGIIDLAVKLYGISQLKAIFDGSETITVQSIHESAKENLKLVQPMIAALRSGDMREIMKYEDIRPISLDEYISSNLGKVKLSVEYEVDTSLEEQAVVKLLDLGISATLAKKCVKEVLKGRKSGQPLNEVVQKAFKKAVLVSDTSVEEKVLYEVDENDLRSVNKNAVYEDLKGKGVIAGENDEW